MIRVTNPSFFLSVAAVLALGPQSVLAAANMGAAIGAQQPSITSAASPVIVTFRDDAQLAGFERNYHADDRAQANPDAWNYLDHGVAGAVEAFEQRHGFRAAQVY